MRITQSTVQVAAALMGRADDLHWGYELSRESGVRAGTMYPILARLLERGWLTDGWEDQAQVEGRPARRYYEVTPAGKRGLGGLLRDAAQDARFRSQRRAFQRLAPTWMVRG